MVERGGCSFPKKIQNAQDFGASLVLISDFEDPDQYNVDQTEYDGTLTSHIPAFEISSKAASKIRNAVSKQGE